MGTLIPDSPEYFRWREEKRAAAMLLGCSFDESTNCFYGWYGQLTADSMWLDADTMQPTTQQEREERRIKWMRWHGYYSTP